MYGPMRRVHSAGDMSPDDEPLLYVRTVWSPLMPSVFIVCSFTHSMFFLKLHSTARVLVEPVAMTLSLTDGWILWTLVVFSEMFYSNRMLEWKHLWSYGGFIYWDVAELFSLNWSQVRLRLSGSYYEEMESDTIHWEWLMSGHLQEMKASVQPNKNKPHVLPLQMYFHASMPFQSFYGSLEAQEKWYEDFSPVLNIYI